MSTTDLINFEGIDHLFFQRRNSSFRNRQNMLFVYEYFLTCYNKCLIFIGKQEEKSLPTCWTNISQLRLKVIGIRPLTPVQNSVSLKLRSVSWSLAEFRYNKIVQSPHENYFNVCRHYKEK